MGGGRIRPKEIIPSTDYGLINEDEGEFTSLEDARRGFREYTGFKWEPERRWKGVGGEGYSEEFGECDVFEEYFAGQLID